jgi:hypothetical protein
VVAAHFEGDGLPEPSEAEGVGYSVYHLPDSEPTEEQPLPAPAAAAEATAPPPTVLGSRGRALLLMAAVLCLIAALLAVWL